MYCYKNCLTSDHHFLSNRPHFLWVYRHDNPHGMLGEHECSSVLPTSQVGYHAGKPLESVVYCFYKITLNKTELFMFCLSLLAQ